jgi:membrane-associated protein
LQAHTNFWQHLLNAVLHADQKIAWFIHHFGAVWAYGVLFFILFCETGLIIAPFLPGDTLLFAAGVLAHPGQHAFNLYILLPVLTIAPLCGDTVNFLIGRWLGPHLFKNEDSKLFKKKHLTKTHEFFEKHGRRTIILARWVPVVRTFSPFVAGMGQMEFKHFFSYCITGAFIWVWACTLAGYFFGSLPIVQDNFGVAMIGMALVTFVPLAFEILRQVKEEKKARAVAQSTGSLPVEVSK